MYETVDGLFTGICDAIREKDGTTALINHQDIPARIEALSGGGGVVFPFYTYDGNGMKIENMVASNFSANSAIFIDEPFLPGDSVWEIGVKFTWPQPSSKRGNVLFGPQNNWHDCPSLYIGGNIDSHKLELYIPNESSYEEAFYVSDVEALTECKVKLLFDGTKYVASLSVQDGAFEDIMQIDYGVMYQNGNNSKIQIGGARKSAAHYFEGSIDIKETYIKIGNEVWWGRG